MDAGMELFASRGFAETSVSAITSHAGYAKGSFYRHWQSKDELFLRIVEVKLAQYRAEREASLARAQSLEQALAVIWDFLASLVAEGNWAKVFLEFTMQGVRDPDLRRRMRRREHRLSEAVFEGLIERFVPPGFPSRKLGALNTALFEGFMVHNALETGILDLADVRRAALTLARDMLAEFAPDRGRT